MPRTISHIEGKNVIVFTLADHIQIPAYNALGERLSVEAFFSPRVFTTLLNQMKIDYDLWKKFKDNKHHQYLIQDIKVGTSSQGIKTYNVRLKDLSKTLVITEAPPKSDVSYSFIRQALGKNTVSTEQMLESFQTEILDYCKTVAASLDEEKGSLGKYHKINAPNAPAITEDEKKQHSKIRQDFLINGFQPFYTRLKNLLLKLTPDDIKTIDEEKLTQNAEEFVACVQTLNQACFYNINGKPINCWSGPEAQIKANETLTSLSDSNVPAIGILIHFGNQLTNKLPYISKLLCGGSSAVFASQARGLVEGYNSSSHEQEGIVLTAGNYHWNEELPKIIRKMETGIVTSFRISALDRSNGTWRNPVEFAEFKKEIKIVRRGSYSSLNPKLHERNMTHIFEEGFRPSISVGQLLNFKNRWGTNASKAKSNRKEMNPQAPKLSL